MNRALFLALSMIISLAVAGCTPQTPTLPAATETALPEPTTPPVADLTLEQVKNAEYTLEFGENILSFTLVNGSYQSGTDTSAPGYFQATMSDKVAFGDLNGDGVGDAAVSIGLSIGGTGVFEYVVALVNQDGQPVQGGYYYVDDRARIDALTIADLRIVADAMVHGPNDPMCCPTLAVQASLQLPLDNGPLLWLAHQTSEIVPGAFREITITSPEPGSSVDSICTITGDVTIAPFENNLVFHVYDMYLNELSVGPLMVDAPDMGAPGTFKLDLDLSVVDYSGPIFITISDLSPADGAILALDSIVLELK
jgi:Immunoglobulin-like domain of bacterial spore germination